MQASLQKGISLISLMVGTTISLFVATGMLQLFKNITRISIESQENAVNDSQITSALLTSGFVLQAAGFGIAQPALGTDFEVITEAKLEGVMPDPPKLLERPELQKLLNQLGPPKPSKLSELPELIKMRIVLELPNQLGLSNLTLSGKTIDVTEPEPEPGSTKSYALMWRSFANLNDTTSQCHALYAPLSKRNKAGLLLLQSQDNCPENMLDAKWRTVHKYLLADSAHFKLHASQQACTSLGHTLGEGTPSTHLLVTITATSSSGLDLKEAYCLRNFVFDPA